MVPLQAGVCYPEEKVRGEVMELVYGDEDANLKSVLSIIGNMYIAGLYLELFTFGTPK